MNRLLDTMTSLMQQNMTLMQTMIVSRQTHFGNVASNQNNEIRNFSVMPDLSKTIDNFTGEKGPMKARNWLQQIEVKSRLHFWPAAFTFETAKSHLVGAAKYWYLGRVFCVTDWITFQQAFRETFVFDRSLISLWKEMSSRRQGFKENLSSYFHQKVTLCKQLELSFRETKEQVAIGLASEDLSKYILSRSHFDEDELYQDIVSFERICQERRQKNFNQFPVRQQHDNY